MDSAGTMMQMGGLGANIMGTMMQGNAAKKAGYYEAAQLRQRAAAEVSAGQSAGIMQAERGRAVEGQARAIGAASGAIGPSNTATIADIMTRTKANQGLEIWKGQVGAAQDEAAARAAIMRGQAAADAARISALGTGLSGFGRIGTKAGLFNNGGRGTSLLDPNSDF